MFNGAIATEIVLSAYSYLTQIAVLRSQMLGSCFSMRLLCRGRIFSRNSETCIARKPRNARLVPCRACTDGTAVVDVEFRTSASHERPASYVHLRWEWVQVRAEGYGGVVVPVRHESQPTTTVRKQNELVMTIGLLPET